MQKNDLVTVAIEDIGVGGEGIGKVDGYTLFIKDAIIGDVVEAKIVKAKKNYGYARLMNIVTPSENRVRKASVSDGEKMWWLPDSGDEVWSPACI